MENCVQLYDDFTRFAEAVFFMLGNEIGSDIFISGTFDNSIYKDILDRILESGGAKKCKIIIPYITGSGIISRSYLNKIHNNGGEIRINSKFKNNVVIIGKHAFVLSFSSRYTKENGLKTNFECCIKTNDEAAVTRLQNNFMTMWQEGLPIMNG